MFHHPRATPPAVRRWCETKRFLVLFVIIQVANSYVIVAVAWIISTASRSL